MDGGCGSGGRSVVKIADGSAKSVLQNRSNGQDDGTPNRSAIGITRRRVGCSPVRAIRSINETVPTAIVTPSPPIHRSSIRSSAYTTHNDYGHNRYVSFSGAHTTIGSLHNNTISTDTAPVDAAAYSAGPTCRVNGTSSLTRRSVSWIGFLGDLQPRKLQYPQDDQRQEGNQQDDLWLGDNLDEQFQAPSNSILSLHLPGNNRTSSPIPFDESQERRLDELEARLQDIEARLANSNGFNNGTTARAKNDPIASGIHQSPILARPTNPTATPKSQGSANKATGNYGVVSVAVPPMISAASAVYRVQPADRSEMQTQREVEQLGRKLRDQEAAAETMRSQHCQHIDQLTRRLILNDDTMQSLRSRIRELEIENELWQNRFRLYNDVDVGKILRENERLRSAQQRHCANESQKAAKESHKLEHVRQELTKTISRYNELVNKCRAMKDKYKKAVNDYRTRARHDHIEIEALKCSLNLQNYELSDLRKRVYNKAPTAPPAPVEAPIAAPASTTTTAASRSTKGDLTTYNLRTCLGITKSLTSVCDRVKRQEMVDPDDLFDFGIPSTSVPATVDDLMDQLSRNMKMLHDTVVQLYADDVVNSVCNVQ